MATSHLTDEELEDLFETHFGPIGQAGRKERATYFDDTRSWVDPRGRRLSDRVWDARQSTRRQIDKAVREAITNGDDAIKAAKRIERYLNPSLAPVRNSKGRMIRKQPKGVQITRTPRDGAGSYPARRLMRTEISRAHGQATKAVAAKFGNGIRWRLSGSHPRADQCDENAQGNSPDLPPNTPPGVYRVNDVPAYPNHPQDLCHLQHWPLQSVDDMVDRIRRKYGLATPEELAAYDARVANVAQGLIDRAAAAEPSVTSILRGIEPRIEGKLEGLEFRLKTHESTVRKLAEDAKEKALNPEQVAPQLFDNLRYTYTLPQDSYGAGVLDATRELAAQGIHPQRIKNFWANPDGYAGVNAIFRTPEGVPFELQFHTAESLYTKEHISHPLYEAIRVMDATTQAAEIRDLNRMIDEAWAEIRKDPPSLEGINEAVGLAR